MKRRVLLSIATVAVALLSSCGDKEETPQPPVAKPVAPQPKKLVKQPFTPDNSGRLTAVQVKKWFASNSDLNKITLIYSDSLQTKEYEAYTKYNKTLTSKKDSICLEHGLKSGFEEYRWISKQIGKAINAPLLDSLKVK